VEVESAAEMRDAVLSLLPKADVVIKAAAVADFTPEAPAERKIKKEDLAEGAGLTLSLVRTPDILAEVCRQKGHRIVVGFAAESHDVLASARRKLERKGCDLIVANDISRADSGFDVDHNTVSFVWPSGEVETLPPLPKSEVASRLLDRVRALRSARG
jgi:phosphopantothenoylcysteine decarboxylase/phosphopantothenate--cysteine ligase